MERKSRFQLRAFVSLLTAFSFLILAVTGIILFITPPGRVANWTGWTFWHFSKHEWSALHICFGSFFILTCLAHLWLNIKPMIRYFIRTVETAKQLRWEPAAALVFCGIIFWGTMKPFVPFSSLLNFNERIKFSWEQPTQQAPIAHAELLTVAELAKQADVETDTILQNLQSHEITAVETDIFGDLASEHNMSPNELFLIATGVTTPSNRNGHGYGGGGGGGSGGGFGQQTLESACQEMAIDIQTALDTLKAAGIEATPDMRIRAIADENNIHPSQIRNMLENQ